jgi:hypothetical protein
VSGGTGWSFSAAPGPPKHMVIHLHLSHYTLKRMVRLGLGWVRVGLGWVGLG